ncbi:MAG: carbohydrate porin [Ignavibacteriales bacterium]|nr:MAG: carbohydrate porin [Ignavibacteriales bacterium]
MNREFLLLTIIIFFAGLLYCQQPGFDTTVRNPDSVYFSTGSKWLTQEASYLGDFVTNLHGGIKTGSLYLGMANIKLGFETKNIGLWNGGEFFVNGAATHGGTPSENLFGDFQVASNIEAGNHIYLHELWYKHASGSFQFKVGLQDLNTEFLTNDHTGSFINSSFGIPSLISGNIPVPIFPLTALGVLGIYELNDKVTLQAAIFDGLPESFESNQYNLNWSLKSDDGVLVFTELQYLSDIASLPGKIKAGCYYHSHLKETSPETGIAETVFEKNYGFYALADQTILETGKNKSLGLFTQLAFCPGNINFHNYYVGGGLNYCGIYSSDEMGIAFAYAHFNNKLLDDEATVELFYKKTISENLFIQPDIQYIINPAGADINHPDALAALIRFGINF